MSQEVSDDLLEAVAHLLESGTDEGCDDLIVMGLAEFLRAQKAMEKITGIKYGPAIEETEEA